MSCDNAIIMLVTTRMFVSACEFAEYDAVETSDTQSGIRFQGQISYSFIDLIAS